MEGIEMKLTTVNFDGRTMKVVRRTEGGTKLKEHPPMSDSVTAYLGIMRTMHAIGMVAQRVGHCDKVKEILFTAKASRV
jgi:hypothetical protein